MNAREGAAPRLCEMGVADVDAVMAIEVRSYGFPWTRGNFVDSLAAGYLARQLVAADGTLVGYLVAMEGVGELHLLNITVAPELRGRGHASTLLDDLEQHARSLGMASIWLEVRAGNAHARRIYQRRGFQEVGVRRGYYPAPMGQREDAMVMSLLLDGGVTDGLD